MAAQLAVEVADPSGVHVTTIDGLTTIEGAVAYWTTDRPGHQDYARLNVYYFTDRGRTTGAELRHPITGDLVVQMLAHPAGWVPA